MANAQGPAADRSAARPDAGLDGARRCPGVRVSRRLVARAAGHAVRARGGEANEHRPGGGANGRHPRRSGRRAGAVSPPVGSPADCDQAPRRRSARSVGQNLDTQPLRINNQPAPLEKDATQFYIPLTGHSPDADVLVEIRYTVAGTAAELQHSRVCRQPGPCRAASVPGDVPAAGMEGARRAGPWTDETSVTFLDRTWRRRAPDDATLLRPHSPRDRRLRHGGGQLCHRRQAGFVLVAPARSGAGRRTATDDDARKRRECRRVLLIVAIGLVLTPQPIGVRLWWLAGLVIVLVLAAVFAPSLATALLGRRSAVGAGPGAARVAGAMLAWAIPSFVGLSNSGRPSSIGFAAPLRLVSPRDDRRGNNTSALPRRAPRLPQSPRHSTAGSPSEGDRKGVRPMVKPSTCRIRRACWPSR